MSDKQHKASENRISPDQMPEEVQRLIQVMLGINPKWSLEDWLAAQANMSLELVSTDLARERLSLEQRIHRLKVLERRVEASDESETDPHQRNIFDCFDFNSDNALLGLGARAASSEDESLPASQEFETHHPAHDFIELLPDEGSDDPLLAVACQMLLIAVEKEMARGKPYATLDIIFREMNANMVAAEEIDEALDHLLMSGTLIEIDDDCFATLDS